MNLGGSSWTDVRDASLRVALLPVGSTEQHGPHAPLSTDALVAERVAREAGDRADAAVVLPTLPVGVSEEHRAFDGTLYVSPSTFRSYVAETARSAPVEKVVVVNGHGGNIDALHEVCARLTRDDDTPFATYWTWWRAVDLGDAEMGHAGRVETSVLLHLAPELVDEDSAAAGADSWGDYAETAPLAYDSAEFTEEGVVGDPTQATAEEGERLYAAAVDSLVRLVGRLAD
ncbi:MAG: creatininase family protein [Halobacteria archaeon]